MALALLPPLLADTGMEEVGIREDAEAGGPRGAASGVRGTGGGRQVMVAARAGGHGMRP